MRLRGTLAGSIVALFVAFPAMAADEKKDAKKEKEKPVPAIAHIKLGGSLDESPNEESLFGGGGEHLKAKLDRIKKAKKDANVQAMLLHIEGLEFGLFSFGKIEELRRAIADFRSTGKKVYCYTEDIGGLDYLI